MTENMQYSSLEYYLPSQIPELLEQVNQKREENGEPSLTISTFYRRVGKGLIGVYPPDRRKRQKAEGYRKSDVDAFLRGELGSVNRTKKHSTSGLTTSQRHELSSIDIVHPEDLPALYYMESIQLGWQQAITPTAILSWLNKNDHVYWMQYDPENRHNVNGVRAVLGVLPVREELIHRLLRRELSPSQITPDDVLAYEPGQKYTCYITSTTALPGQQAALRQMLQYLLAYWCEQSIQVERLYALSPETTEETPLMRLAADCYFSPLEEFSNDDGSMAWSLRFGRFNPSLFIQEYQKCIQRKQDSERLNETPMASNAPTIDTLTQETLQIERELEGSIRTKTRNFEHLSQRLFSVDSEGRLDAERLKKSVWFRHVRSDDDIRACLRINASLFGDSKKYTEDELVAQRRLWLEKNPDIYRVLEVDSEVVGFISAFPLPMDTIHRILHSEIRMGDVSIDDLQIYKPGVPVNIYLQTIGVHKRYQGLEKRRLGVYMASGFRDMVNGFGRRGIELQSIYTRSDEVDGINMSYGLGFQKMPPIPGVDKLVFRLDFSTRDLPFLLEYQHALGEYQARRSAHAIRSASR